MVRWLVAALLFLAALVAALPARAETVEELDARLEKELAAKSPDAVEPFRAANRARLVAEHAKARELLDRVLVLAPDFAPALRRACQADFELGRRAEAIDLCRRAVAVEKLPLDDVTLAIVLTSRPSTKAETAEALELARRALQAGKDDPYVIEIACEVAEDASDAELIRAAADLLSETTSDPNELVCKAYAAATRGEIEPATRYVKRAERAGASRDLIKNLRGAIEAAQPSGDRRALRILEAFLSLFAVLIVAALLALGIGAIVANRARKGRVSGVLGLLSRATLWLFAALQLLAIVGLVVTTVLSILLSAQGWLALGGISPPFVVASLALLFATIGLPRMSWQREEPDGIALGRAQHEKLHALVAEAAAKVGVSEVSTLYLTAGVEVRAFERGNLASRLLVPGARCLSIGAAGLVGMRTGELAALTSEALAPLAPGGAGGAFARAILGALDEEAAPGATWWFTRGFVWFFARASAGARVNDGEVGARRAAAAFAPGLFARAARHLARRAVRHRALVDAAIVEAADAPIENVYAYEPERPLDTRAEVADALADLPPAPGGEAPADDTFAWTLIDGRDALEKALTRKLLETRPI